MVPAPQDLTAAQAALVPDPATPPGSFGAAPIEPVDPCQNCPCAKAVVKAPSLVSRIGRRLLSVLHDKPVKTELKKLAPILVFRAVVYAGGSVEAAKLIEQALKAAGI